MQIEERANEGLHAHVADVVIATVPGKGARILDLGCGSGAFLKRLKALGFHGLNGVDIDPPDDAGDGIVYAQLDLDSGRIPFPDASFDFIVAIEVLEHIENLGIALAEIRRLLAPQGLVIATTPNVHSVEARLRLLLIDRLKQFDEIGDPTHIAPIFLHPFAKLLARHGLRKRSHWGFPLDGRSPTSRPALRLLADAVRLAGLGGRGGLAGDNLCLLIEHAAPGGDAARSKQQALTAHY